MKRLLKLVLAFLVVAAVIAWLRQKLVPATPMAMPEPQPEPATTTPERVEEPEPSPPLAEEPPVADDLTVIKGIGPTYRSRLADQDVTSFSQLIAADTDALAAAVDASASQVESWQEEARTRLA